MDRTKLTKQVAEAAGRAIEKAGEKAAIVAKTNAPLAADMLKIAKKTAKDAAAKALSED